MNVTLIAVVLLTTAALCYAADAECKYRKTRKLALHWPDPTDCTRYYRCTNRSVKREVVCAGDKVYNAKIGKCSNNIEGLCKLTLATPLDGIVNPCANETSGVYLEQPGFCRNFYICNQNQAYSQVCDAGSRFNSTTRTCIPDTDSECWQNKCVSERSGTYLPNESSCSSFYVCAAGETIEQECGSGSYFNISKRICMPDPDGHFCWENLCVGKKDGEFVQNVKDCYSYYVCVAAKPIQQYCPEGSYFNSAENGCLPGECLPVTTDCPITEVTTSTTECTSKSTESSSSTECTEVTTPTTEAACDCPGGYKEGELVPFPNYPENCDKYYECSNGKLEEKECGKGNGFNSTLGVCEPDVDNICWPVVTTECPEVTTLVTEAACDCPGGYKEGELVPFPNYPKNCDKYYACSNGKLEEKECGQGNGFNSTLGVCEPDVDNICWPVVTTECPEVTTLVTEAACDCPGGYKEGELVPFPNYPENCDKYYECSNGKLEEKKCGQGNGFNSTLGVCEPDVDNICWPVVTTECPEVTTLATEAACYCPGGYKEGELVPFPNYPENCDKYYACSNGKLEEKECGQGNGFNSTLGVCEPDVDNICWPVVTTECPEVTTLVTEAACDCPGGYKEGELVPFPNYPENCDKYYECSNGKLEEKKCGQGNGFNSTLGVCEPDVDNICWPVVTTECPEVTTLATEAACDCPGGYKEGELVPFPNYPENCDKYYACSNGKLEEKECGQGNGFNSTLGVCEPDVDNICWPVVTTECPEVTTLVTEAACDCPGGYKEGELVPFPNYPENCDKYYECSNGKLEERECGKGNRFNSILGVCEPDVDNICWPVVTTECPEVTTLVTEAACDCPGGYKEGELVPFPNYPENCDKYYECSNGKLEEKKCGQGNGFNSTLGVCEPDVDNICWPVVTTECPEVTTLATEAACDCPGGYKEGELVPFPNYPENCDKYYACSNGKLEEKECGQGNGFNSTLGVCEPDVDNICWPVVTTECPEVTTLASEAACDCPGGYKEGELVPFPNYPENCDKYYECSNGKLEEKECGKWNRFNGTLGVCQPDIENVCSQMNCDVQNYNLVRRRNRRSVDRSSINTFDVPICMDLYTEGEVIEDPSNCRKYQVCINGKMISEDCGFGNYFNSNTLTCNVDTQPVCIPNYDVAPISEKDEERTASASNIIEADCICPGGYKEGELLPFPNYPENCDKYYICIDGKLEERECGVGNYFDNHLGVCAPDVDNTCRPADPNCTCPGGYKEGELLPFPNFPENCDKYYICIDGKLEERVCGVGNYFDKHLGVCVPDVDNTCRPADANCTCPGGYKEGDLVPFPNFPENCDKYYICTDGKLQGRECGSGNYFDSHLGVCVPDVDNTCRPADANCTCPGGYKEGELLPFPNFPENCDKYYICIDGKLEERECGVGNYFDKHLGVCVPDVDNTCRPADANCTCPGGYKEGDLLPFPNFPENCDKYYICTDGKLQGRECGSGNYFDSHLGVCVPDVDNTCRPADANCTCPGGYKEGDLLPFPNFPENCDKYYICTGGKLQGRECGSGNYFDNLHRVCEPDVNNTCWPNVCNDQIDGTYMPDSTNCTSFYFCKGGKGEIYDCPPEKWFNPVKQLCMPDYNATCINPCEDTNGITFLPNPDCSKYFLCNDGKPYVETCPEGGFDITLNKCHTQAVCEATLCVGKSDGITYPLIGNDTKFYLCMGGVAQIRECDSGQVFNEGVGVCLEQPSSQCNQSVCHFTMSEANAFAPLTNTAPHNTAFCLCRGNSAFLHHCVDNYTFRADLGICYSNAPCDPELCNSFPENMRSQNRNDSHSFCLCVSKQQVIVDCPNNQTYNAVTQICQVLDKRCSPTFCLTAPEYSTFPALNNDTDGFCACVSSGNIYKLCGNSKKYNAEKGICLPEIGDVCSSSFCSGNTGLIFGAASDPHSFCYCINDGLAIKQNCPNSEVFNEALLICQAVGCNGQICLTNPSSPFPAINEPYAFCICGSSDPSSVTKHDCVNGTRFDPYYLLCKEDPCDKNFCSNSSNDGIPYPANNYRNGYCVCKSGIPELNSCSGGTAFNLISSHCEPSNNVDCDLSQCANATSQDPYAIIAKNDTHGFCYCFSPTEVEFFLCPDNALFNPIHAICNIGGTNDLKIWELNQGVSPVSCVGTYREGEYVPHPTNNQLYYICYNSKLTEGDCGQGNVFDQDSLTCQSLGRRLKHQNKHIMRTGVVREDNTWSIENEKRYVRSKCSQYEVCVDGVWIQPSCPDGQFFSSEEYTCIERSNNMICIYDRVKSFPNCSASMELHTVPGKDANCTQCYRCNHGKWLLKNCPKLHFYTKSLNTCIPSSEDDVSAAQHELNIDIMIVQEFNCRHMEVRHYESNCAMYLMCLDGKLWHHYCPTGTYYNRLYNYCIPDLDGLCSVASRPSIAVYSEQEYFNQSCILKGALRPSALACNRYYVCQGSFWELKFCSFRQYFNLTEGVCLPDIENICLQRHKTTCHEGERREFPFNCTSYKKCVNGEWQKQSCKSTFMFDKILHECVPNIGECAEDGLRKFCENGVVRAHPFSDNCTQFYYCLDGIWKEGICLKGHTYSNDLDKCVPHEPHDKCQPHIVERKAIIDMSLDSDQPTFENNISVICLGRENGSAVPHPESCLHFFICHGDDAVKEQKCIPGAFFDATLGYCRPNNGSCMMSLKGICANSTDGGRVSHPYDCQAYYECSTLKGTELRYCAEGEYYHNITGECRIDRGECRPEIKEHGKCTSGQHGKNLSHGRYCNIYFACVRGLAIPVICPAGNHFNPVVGRCVLEAVSNCENGSLSGITKNIKSKDICKNLSDGVHLPVMADCTKYYVCSAGMELKKKCPSGAYFDSEQLLCVPDDGSCPYVVKTQSNLLVVPPEPSICEGKHGVLMRDPLNCNEFYVCINGKLRHERCYTNYYFNSSILQCQSYKQAIGNTTDAGAGVAQQLRLTQNLIQCKHKPSNYTALCLKMPKGSSIAEQGDCRRYVRCNDVDNPVSQRCRNGESYDSLLGFCRQNDGTCLLENGQRVGECNARHGELVRHEGNCQAYFVCINGQKIPGNCNLNEYFDKIQASCLPDENNQCGKALSQVHALKTPAVSCLGLSDSILYPYTLDNCRSYFQCVHGTPVVHKCADGLYFDASITRCVKDMVNCTKPIAAPK